MRTLDFKGAKSGCANARIYPSSEPMRAPGKGHVLTFQDLMDAAETLEGLQAPGRRVLKSHIKTAAYVATANSASANGSAFKIDRGSVDLASVRCDVQWLNDNLFALPPQVLGLSRRGFDNTITDLRRIMRHVGLIKAKAQRCEPSHHWAAILKGLESQHYCKIALASFADWCQRNAIEPSMVKRETLVSYGAHLRASDLKADIPGRLSAIAKAWRKAGRVLSALEIPALRPGARPDHYTLPFSSFPQSFQEDIERFIRHLTGSARRGPFRGDGPPKTLRPGTIHSRIYNLRQAASALVLDGRCASTIEGLANLVEEDSFKSILLFFWRRAIVARNPGIAASEIDDKEGEAGVTSQTGAIASALMMVAKYHCKLEGEPLARLRALASDLTPRPQTELTQKNRDRLRQFDNPETLAKFLHLPDFLMRKAEALRADNPTTTKSFEAAQMARTAVAVFVLLHVPMRISNLVRLRLGYNLKYSDMRSQRISHISLQAHETKNRRNIEWAIGRELDAFLNHYIKIFRPALAKGASDFLFPAGFGKQGPLSEGAMAAALKSTIAEMVGAIVNPHLFRCFAAKIALEANPNCLEDVRQLLGDKTLMIVLAHYAALEPSKAARRHGEVLATLSRELRSKTAHQSRIIRKF